MKALDLENMFYQGYAADLLERTIDSIDFQCTLAHAPWVILSLAWLGRIEEAKWQYENWQERLSNKHRVMCRFFLGITLMRLGDGDQARSLLIENVRELKRTPDQTSRFFIYQGLAFYRFQRSRFALALKHASRSFECAVIENFTFGKIFAADLRGHSLIFTGKISQGLHYLQTASELAAKLGNLAIQKSIQSAIFFYEAKFGLNKRIMTLLSKKLDEAESDSYSKTMLLIELARQLTLRGQISQSMAVLREASQQVYARDNRKQAAKINLRLAHNYLIQGNAALALKLIANASNPLNEAFDPVLESEKLGLKLKALTFQGLTEQQPLLLAKLKKLQRMTGESVSRRILERYENTISYQNSDDPFADLIDEVSLNKNRFSVVKKVVDLKLYLFLYPILGVQYGEHCLFINLFPGQNAIFANGDILVFREAVSKKISMFFKLCSQGKIDKSTMIEQIWGYSYVPFRHDHLIYNLVARARRFLGPYASWIRADEDGYSLDSNIRLITDYFKSEQQDSEQNSSLLVNSEMDLNIRQILAIDAIKDLSHLNVRKYMEITNATKVTATRDLQDLVEKSIFRKIGKGRATAYIQL